MEKLISFCSTALIPSIGNASKNASSQMFAQYALKIQQFMVHSIIHLRKIKKFLIF